MMGSTIKRSALFGLPLQQHWSHAEMGEVAPTYYMQADAPLYYYSFTDAYIAMQYKSLTPAEQSRLDPLISGFNPADMYGVDHIRRVLTTFPGVFCGIGEFSVNKEFVSSKIAGEKATLGNPALDRILEFAGEVGLVALIHTDIEKPFPKPGQPHVIAHQTRDLFLRHPNTTMIWAHVGLGRVVKPVENQAEIIERALNDPALEHVHFDISWDEVAKYAIETDESAKRVADVINRHPDRFLFGTDCVAPGSVKAMTDVFHKYDRVWKLLTPEASRKVRLENHERLFDRARKATRAWEKANLGQPARGQAPVPA
jgi:predicted TIM-barrel fold metal-dependent hydrolase